MSNGSLNDAVAGGDDVAVAATVAFGLSLGLMMCRDCDCFLQEIQVLPLYSELQLLAARLRVSRVLLMNRLRIRSVYQCCVHCDCNQSPRKWN